MKYRLSWMRLLSQSRPKKESENEGAPTVTYTSDDTRSAFERDYDRIIFSAAFRRLARKTQVHPLASNDHIHNRLTHSLEVASIGRAFARRLAKFAVRVSDLTEADETKLIWIIQSACLMHDLGNPPFGHAGEEVVRAWSRKHSSEMFERKRFGTEKEYEGCFADWLYFEGNAQGFRIAARSDNPEVSYLHLTHAAMGAAIKYPWTSIDTRARKKGKHNI
jgi:dGTPase